MRKLLLSSVISVLAMASSNCIFCHNGGMANKLDTLTPKEIIEKMKEYKAGKGNRMMVSIAQGMSNEEIEEVAKTYGRK